MSMQISLDSMSIAEKLVLMETLWADLSRRPEDIPTPQWHGSILAERMEAVKNGIMQFDDWEAAKRRLRERLP